MLFAELGVIFFNRDESPVLFDFHAFALRHFRAQAEGHAAQNGHESHQTNQEISFHMESLLL
jgi:hypothetical protein